MRNTILIIGVIICSFASGYIGSKFPSILNSFPQEEREATVSPLIGEKISMQDLETNITQIVADTAPSVVSIIIKKDMVIYRSDPWGFFHQAVGSIEREIGGGSGFFIRKDGVILTNKHVVSDREAQYSVVLNNGDEYDAKLLGYTPDNDLALIQIHDNSKEFPPLKVRDKHTSITLGSFAIAVGNALAEFQNSVSLGIISGKNRELMDGNIQLNGLLQTDAAINPGNSGGPLISLDGSVTGINTAIVAGADGVGFAIELNDEMIQGFLDNIK